MHRGLQCKELRGFRGPPGPPGPPAMSGEWRTFLVEGVLLVLEEASFNLGFSVPFPSRFCWISVESAFIKGIFISLSVLQRIILEEEVFYTQPAS